MTVEYVINHAISPELETWLASQPDFVSIDIQPNITKVYYDHASESEELAFKDLLADQIALAGENVNTSDTNILTNVAITPPTLTADVDDYNPTGLETASVIRQNGGTAPYYINGLAGGYEGRIITIISIGTSSDAVNIRSEALTSDPENRFVFTSRTDEMYVYAGDSITFRYDSNDSRWHCLSNTIPQQSIFGEHLGNDSSWYLGTSVGMKFGTGPTEKLSFYGATRIVQPAANPDTSGATLGQLETEVNQLKQLLRDLGLMAP